VRIVQGKNVYSVTEINSLARRTLEQFNFWVEGELSSFKGYDTRYRYLYFDLKDPQTGFKLPCIFDPEIYLANYDYLKDGMKVLALGILSLWEKEAKFQMQIFKIVEQGEGSLLAELEKLKESENNYKQHTSELELKLKKTKKDLKVAITIGVHPAISIAGAYQAEWGKDEIDIANSLLGGKLTLAQCPSTGLFVPSEAEIVMEGKILTNRTHKEWMVEMLRTYDHQRKQPVFELEKLYFRNNPIFHDVLSGHSEHRLLMGMPIEAKLNGEIKKTFSQTKQVCLSNGGSNWLHAVVQIKKRTENDAKKIIKKTFQTHRSLKMVTVVDEDIDPTDSQSVEYAMATRFQADRDLVIIKNVRGSSLDPSSNQTKLKTAKMGIDATKSFRKRKEGFEIAKIPKKSVN